MIQYSSSRKRNKQGSCFALYMCLPCSFVLVLLLPLPLLLVILPTAISSHPPAAAAAAAAAVAASTTSSEEQRLIEEFLRHRYDIQLPNVGDGQSALVDKQSRRVYWQSGGPTIHPQDVFGRSFFLSQWSHCKAIILSTFLWTCILTLAITQRLWQYMVLLTKVIAQPPPTPIVTTTADITAKTKVAWMVLSCIQQFVRKIISVALSIILILTKPRFQQFTCNPYVIAIIYLLYLSESYTSSTRRYLANTLSQHHVETLMEHLRNTKPIVTWSIRCFHYDVLPPMLLPSPGAANNTTTAYTPFNKITNFVRQRKSSTATRRKKVFTHQATTQFEFSSWSDHSIVGLWKRAPISLLSPVTTKSPFTKVSFSKMLVLADEKIREEYFSQQAKFISLEGRKDEQAEYSTTIEVMGLKSNNTNKVLVVRDADKYKWFHNLYMFWFVTLLGFTVPFRIWFSRHCDDVRVTLIKEISSNVTTTTSKSIGLPSWGSFLSRSKGDGNITAAQLELRREQFRQAMRTLDLYPCSLNNTTNSTFDTPIISNQKSISKDESIASNHSLVEEDTLNEASEINQTAALEKSMWAADNGASSDDIHRNLTGTNILTDDNDNQTMDINVQGVTADELTLQEGNTFEGDR